ncbi:hypothetical protein TEA_008177 [Camellia sinensis var. sinensis]|uniref:BAH domain-containing protein n=1 Tax=Camellia sinensis var. sinensis TaxID=542762 RepID=A0A4S4EKJ1_CAMSN|nr:hypothetical protein TEA_008177 [Camellia sinensis var. sinensis]
MAKTRPGRRDLDSYTIRGTNKVVRAGDCVLMRPSDNNTAPYVALVEKIEADNRSNIKVRVRWYYRPEESMGGRRQFHGAKELFLSDHYDVQSAHTIEGKCTVHSFKNYTKLENVGTEDYYCRFEYHPACVNMTIEQAKMLDHFMCSDCSSDNDIKKPQNTYPSSPLTNGKYNTVTGDAMSVNRKMQRTCNFFFPGLATFSRDSECRAQAPEEVTAFRGRILTMHEEPP